MSDDAPAGRAAPAGPARERLPGRPLPLEAEPVVGPYRLLRVLGAGGMGTVYLAEPRDAGRERVALKVVRARGRASQRMLERFAAEHRVLAQMGHPNVATFFDAGTNTQGEPYFVMELVPGEPIVEYCDRRRLPIDRRVDLFLDVCRALQHAHERGVVHCDLKSTNVLVTDGPDGPVPKVIDFGLARRDGEDTEGGVALPAPDGAAAGTLAAMSPEQLAGRGVGVDARTDVYGLGVLLYELLAGRPPFTATSERELATAILRRRVPRPSRVVERLGERAAAVAAARDTTPPALARRLAGGLDRLVLAALAKRPRDRPSSAAAFAAELERLRVAPAGWRTRLCGWLKSGGAPTSQ